MRKNIIRLALILFLFPLISFAENTENLAINETKSTAELLRFGNEFYHKKSYVQAEEAFKMASLKEPKNYVILYNWGLSLFQIDKKPLAVAVLRKAQNLNPHHIQIGSALDFILSSMGFNPVTLSSDSFEYLRTKILQRIPMSVSMGLWTLFLFFSIWFILTYFGQRIRSLKNEKPLPAFPALAALFSFLWILISIISISKWFDQNTIRATIILERASILAGPSKDQLTLFELNGGSEVIVQIQSKDWVQVKAINSGNDGMSGWIAESSIMKTQIAD